MNTKRFAVGALALTMAVTAMAVPARRGQRTVTQPDGTTLTVQVVGDENLHFTLTADNLLLAQDEATGAYCYGRLDNATGNVVSTGVRALDAAVRPEAHRYLTQSFADIDADRVQSLREANGYVRKALPLAANLRKNMPQRAIAQSGMGLCNTSFPSKGSPKALIILAQYTDIKFNTNYKVDAHTYFSDMLTKDGFNEYNGTGSAAQYFREMSNGQFTPQFDVVGPVTLPNNRKYYGGNVSGDDQHPALMVAQACRLVDDQVNFADYDNDGDGIVDNVFVFYAGQGEASYGPAESIWPHAWMLEGEGLDLNLDGVHISSYGCTNEWESSRPDGVGTFVHEFSHVMGLPDLYHTTNSSVTYTPGSYSVLDYGPYNNSGCTPPAYSAYERNAMGWIDLHVLSGPESVTLEHIYTSNDACIALTEKANEFFLFENRQLSSWDKYIPGHGMLIWHIDYNSSVFNGNRVNNTSSHQYVDIVEANGRTSSSASVMAGYTWPGTGKKTAFTSTTTPAFKSWSGKAIALPITDIAENNGVISFDVDGGNALETPEVATVAAVEKGEDYFVATWGNVDGATDYLLSVYAIDDQGATVTTVADMGSSTTLVLPEGWTRSAVGDGAYTTYGNYGEASPSLKFKTDGSTLTSATYASPIKALSFWMKGMTVSGDTKLTVDGLTKSGDWTNIGDAVPTNSATTVEFTNIPDGVVAIRFTFAKSAGNIGIDDIKITTGGRSESVLPGYDRVSTAGATTMRVNLNTAANAAALLANESNYGKYEYDIVATDGVTKSRPSARVSVDMSTAVDDILSDTAAVATINVQQRTVTVANTTALRVEVFDTVGRLTLSVPVSNGAASFNLPDAGLYIVRANTLAAKVAVQ